MGLTLAKCRNRLGHIARERGSARNYRAARCSVLCSPDDPAVLSRPEPHSFRKWRLTHTSFLISHTSRKGKVMKLLSSVLLLVAGMSLGLLGCSDNPALSPLAPEQAIQTPTSAAALAKAGLSGAHCNRRSPSQIVLGRSGKVGFLVLCRPGQRRSLVGAGAIGRPCRPEVPWQDLQPADRREPGQIELDLYQRSVDGTLWLRGRRGQRRRCEGDRAGHDHGVSSGRTGPT